MAMLYLAVVVGQSHIGLIRSSSVTCDQNLSLRGLKMRSMINRTLPLSRNINLTLITPVCNLDEHDMSDTCSTPAETLPFLPVCPDGSWNRTCYPVPTHNVNYHLKCVCHSFVPMTDVRDTYWSDYEALSPPVDGAFYTSRLMMDGGECITRELIKIGPVVAGYNLPDGVYTASSVYSNQYKSYRAKITDYLEGGACGWVAHGTDTDPWLGVNLPDDWSYYINPLPFTYLHDHGSILHFLR